MLSTDTFSNSYMLLFFDYYVFLVFSVFLSFTFPSHEQNVNHVNSSFRLLNSSFCLLNSSSMLPCSFFQSISYTTAHIFLIVGAVLPSQGYALIEYETFTEVQAAITNLIGAYLLSQPIYVDLTFNNGPFGCKIVRWRLVIFRFLHSY